MAPNKLGKTPRAELQRRQPQSTSRHTNNRFLLFKNVNKTTRKEQFDKENALLPPNNALFSLEGHAGSKRREDLRHTAGQPTPSIFQTGYVFHETTKN